MKYRAQALAPLRLAVFLALNAIAAMTYLNLMQPSQPIPPWKTSSTLRTMPHAEHVDIILLGTSHARNLSGCPASAKAVEESLGTSVLNLAKNGAGPSPLRLYLEEFYARDNSADRLIYFADPWAFYAPKWNEEHGFLMDEPLEPRFFARCVLAGKSPKQLFRYVRYGFIRTAYSEQLTYSNDCFKQLKTINPSIVADRIDNLYNGTLSDESLEHYTREFSRLAANALAHGTQLLIVTPPTLLGQLPGMDPFVEAMNALAIECGAHYFNFADIMQEPRFFVDHDHLNAQGVAHFAENYLQPALIESTNQPN